MSGVDSQQWNELLCKFGKPSEELREAVASLTRRIANNIIPWDDIRALKAKKLIALDKCQEFVQLVLAMFWIVYVVKL